MAIIQKDGTKTHEGMCLMSDTWYNSSMDVMSYYVIAYNVDTKQFDRLYVNCDFPSDGPQATFTIDATPEVIAIWEAKKAAEIKAQRERQELIDLMTPAKGKRLEVIRGRKVPHGTTGICFWIGNGGYGMSVGIKDANGNVHFTAINNVQVV